MNETPIDMPGDRLSTLRGSARQESARLAPPSAVGASETVPLLLGAESTSLFSRQRLLSWSTQGFWAILDQALFAFSSLLINVLLARWLPPDEYGAFVTAQTMLLLVSVAHASFLCEPMLVFGSDRYAAGFSHYLRILQRYHWRLTLGISSCLAAAALVLLLGNSQALLGQAAAGLAVTAPFILLSWLARRACYVVGKPRLAAFGGSVSLTVVIVGAIVLARLQALSMFSGQLLQGAAALSASALMLVPLRRVTTGPLDGGLRTSIGRDHWNYGRWSGATGLVSWFNGYIYYFALPLWGGLAATGALKALLNLVMPILQSDSALVTLLTPAFVRSRRRAGRFARVTTLSAAGFVAESAVYWVLVVVFGRSALEWVYGGAYRFSAMVMVLVGLVPLVGGLSNVLATALRARQQPEGVFWATIAGAIATSTFGLFAAASYGVAGAIVGMVSASAFQVVVILWLLRK